MADLQTLVRSEMDRAGSPSYSFEDLSRRRARRNRNRRITAAVLAIILALVSFAALIRTFRTVERPAKEPTDIFARVHGWIVYCVCPYTDYYQEHFMQGGIWAVDPTRPGDPNDQIKLSDRLAEPLAWSSDGSKLLIWYLSDLFVLNADGTETRLAVDTWGVPLGIPSASLSPNGSQVVYSNRGRIYVVDAEGGTPRLLLSPRRRRVPGGRKFRTSLYEPAFSPDGTQIAYFDGMGDWGHSLRIMNAEGSNVRVLMGDHPTISGPGHVHQLAWSPDGSRLAFEFEGGIWVIHADGSGLTQVIRNGVNPSWSPDGSRISYQPIDPRSFQRGMLKIATLDGTRVTSVQKFGYAGSGAWNPLPLSVPSSQGPAATASRSSVAPLIYTIAALGVLGLLVLAWRARRKTGAS